MKTTFPKEPGRILRLMDILIELEANIHGRSLIASAIREGLRKEGSKVVVLDMIKSHADADYWSVADVIGYKLLDKIIAFK